MPPGFGIHCDLSLDSVYPLGHVDSIVHIDPDWLPVVQAGFTHPLPNPPIHVYPSGHVSGKEHVRSPPTYVDTDGDLQVGHMYRVA